MDDSKQTGPITRERLIEAAGEIFAEKGLHGARIRDITERAGANIASVNYHFRDKLELYTVVLQKAHERTLAAMNQPPTAATPEGRIRELLSALLNSALDPARPKWHRMLLGRELMRPTPALDRMHELLRKSAQRLQEAVQEIRPDLSDEEVMLAASGIVAQTLFQVHHRHVMHRLFPALGEPTAETLVGHVVEFLLSALHNLPRAGTDHGHAADAAEA
jgi:AcrR family transcriptional regulator